jgi:hypothetical protein
MEIHRNVGEPKTEEKEKTWENLRLLKEHFDLPWFCIGDFSEILFQHEEGGAPKPERMMEQFRQALEDCGLHDLGVCGGHIYLAKQPPGGSKLYQGTTG